MTKETEYAGARRVSRHALAIVWILCLKRRIRIARLPIIDAIANDRIGAVVLAGIVGFAVSTTTGLWRGIPVPRIHDEFCYLLAADTYAHGRLTNRPHPEWEHFESIHLLSQPTLMSKYPPGQALVLALGEMATGEPITGVWFSIGLAGAAVCWMLRCWVPARWACFGGICLALRLATNYWGQSYWGGSRHDRRSTSVRRRGPLGKRFRLANERRVGVRNCHSVADASL